MLLTSRVYLVVLVVTAVEVAWTFFCAIELPQTSVYLVLYYSGLVLGSLVFFIPSLAREEPVPTGR